MRDFNTGTHLYILKKKNIDVFRTIDYISFYPIDYKNRHIVSEILNTGELSCASEKLWDSSHRFHDRRVGSCDLIRV